jgi:hypothetical protein
MTRLCRVLTLLGLFAFSMAASIIVAPNANSTVEGNDATVAITLGNVSTFQWAFAASQFTGVPVGSRFTAIGFRGDASSPNQPAAGLNLSQWNLQLSASLNSVGSLSDTPASNIGPDAVTVHSGALSIPAGQFTGGAGPNAFSFIPFTQPYTYSGGDLLLTLQVSTGDSISLDAVSVGGVTDSIGVTPDGTAAHFFNVPVTALQYDAGAPTGVPEPATFAITGGVLLGLFAMRLRKAN